MEREKEFLVESTAARNKLFQVFCRHSSSVNLSFHFIEMLPCRVLSLSLSVKLPKHIAVVLLGGEWVKNIKLFRVSDGIQSTFCILRNAEMQSNYAGCFIVKFQIFVQTNETTRMQQSTWIYIGSTRLVGVVSAQLFSLLMTKKWNENP